MTGLRKALPRAGGPRIVKAGAANDARPLIDIKDPERVKLADLNFAPFNPRHMPAPQMEALKASLLKHGLVLNLVVQRLSEAHGPMVILGGHQRVKALRSIVKERGCALPSHVWAVVLDVNDSTAVQLNLALNRISGDFDDFAVGELLAKIAAEPDFDGKATGYGEDEIALLIERATGEAQTDPDDCDDLDGFERTITLSIDFDTEKKRDQARDLLKQLAGGSSLGSALLPLLRAAVKRKS